MPSLHLEVDVPCMGICVHPAMHKNHLSKGVAKQLRAFGHVQAGSLQGCWIAGLAIQNEDSMTLQGNDICIRMKALETRP